MFTEFLKKYFGNLGNRVNYGVLRKCSRCVYAKSHEPILIFSLDRGPRILIYPQIGIFVKHGNCIGFQNCNKCFLKVIDSSIETPCQWVKI